MSTLLKNIKNLLTYKKPTDIEGFELLEGEYEGIDRYDQPESNVQNNENKNKNQKDKRPRSRKTPLTVYEWNEAKNENNTAKPKTADSLVTIDIRENLERMKKEFNMHKNVDAIIRQFKVARKMDAFIIYIDGMVDRPIINNFTLKPLMMPEHFEDFKEGCPLDYIANNVLSVNRVSKEKEYQKIMVMVLNGLTALFLEGCEECLLVETRGYEKRSIDMPATETVVRGSQEGFTEDLRTNITLIRRIIKNIGLVTEILPVGKTNKINSGIVYLDGVANPGIVKEVKRRINSLDTDYIGASGMLEQLIEENPLHLFPQTLTTERPDRAASFLMEGKIIIITEGTPFVTVVPTTFWDLLHTSEDYNLRWQFGTFLRLIRIVGMAASILLPGLYVGLTLYHQEMIPTELLTAIAQASERVPFPAVIEVLLIEISFELIREGGTRVPGVIGNTLGIVGALILGQAAVQANIVSPILVIVSALTGLGNFTIPNYTLTFAVRILRFLFIFLSGIAGFYGISVGLFIIAGLMCSMKSFGMPYLSPIAPKTGSSRDIIMRQPLFSQRERPDSLNPLDKKRQGQIVRKWKMKNPGGKNK